MWIMIHPVWLALNLPTTTIVAQPFNIIKWQLKFKPVAQGLDFAAVGKTWMIFVLK
jgi:hypothetical protein